MFMGDIPGLEDIIVKVSALLSIIYKFKAIEIKILGRIFCGTWQAYSNINVGEQEEKKS